MKTFDYEEALLNYEAAILKQRIKYTDTPPGIKDSAAVSTITEDLRDRQQAYEMQKIPALLTSDTILTEPFAGRKEELSRIDASFREGRGPVIICGIGGIGKTALARAYAAKAAGQYSHILFLTCGSSLLKLFTNDSLVPVRGFEYRSELYGTKKRYLNVKLKALAEAVRREETLIIIDDWNRAEGSLGDSILRLPCDILVTTRTAPSLWPCGTAFELKALDDELEWKEFYTLFERGTEVPEELQTQIMEELHSYQNKVQGHTLRMKIAAADLFRSKQIPRDVPSSDLLGRFSLRQKEIQALMMLSAMPVGGVSVQRFAAISGTDQKTLDTLSGYLLTETSVCSFSEDGDKPFSHAETSIRIHPLIAEEVRSTYSPTAEKCRKLFQGLAGELKLIWHRPRRESDSWEPVVSSVLYAFPDPVPSLAREYETICTWMWIQEYYDEALRLMKIILSAVEKYYGPAHTITGEMQLRMAAVYFNSRNYENADIWYERAYATLKSISSKDCRHRGQLSLAASKLSRVYRSRRDYIRAMELIDEAIRLFYECIDSLKQLDTSAVSLPFHTYLTVSYYYLDKGKIYLRTGRIEEAKEMYSMSRAALTKDPVALDLADNSFGSTEYTKFQLSLLTAENKWEESEKLARSMLDYTLRWRPPGHSYTLVVRKWLADILTLSRKQEESI